jgi:AraC family transcriptional regulator, regulatory protein of adaptative response / methylated-DNA-[protein]-cysteine methyltransferase
MATEKGVCGLAFGNEGDEPAILADMKTRWPKGSFVENPARTDEIARRIFETGGDVALQLMGTPWQTQVWQALLAIPPGKFATYGGIAEQLGKQGAARAVGAAVGRNPIAWLIPCHRVLAANGNLHGYHWGATRKRAMLAIEAAETELMSRAP